jgi:uncharacterized membrane protein YgaE (UPF0421/DUF939 family)
MPVNLLIYIAKCIAGSAIVFLLSWLLDYSDISWCLISVILVLTPESSEAVPLAVTRIKANFIGGIASVLCMLFLAPSPLTIILAMVLTIFGCYFFNLMTGSRAAIAAVIIIMMHGLEYRMPDFWTGTLKRLLMVIIGCIIGLLVTIIFHRRLTVKNEGAKSQEG